MVLRKEAVSEQSIPVSTPNASRVMVQLGVFLGVVYLLFLAVWIWATRLRSRD
jgi:predicted RNA polymerase sigma factor